MDLNDRIDHNKKHRGCHTNPKSDPNNAKGQWGGGELILLRQFPNPTKRVIIKRVQEDRRSSRQRELGRRSQGRYISKQDSQNAIVRKRPIGPAVEHGKGVGPGGSE